MRKKILFLAFIGFIFFALNSSAFAAEDLVLCGRSGGEACTLCDLVVGFHNLVQYGLEVITIIALAGITFAGVMYTVSSGNESMVTSSKNFMKASVIGFAVVFCAWLIVNQVLSSIDAVNKTGWNTFSCQEQQ